MHALPLRRSESVIGALSLFCSRPGTPSEADERFSQALADVAATGITVHRSAHQPELLAAQLQKALDSRVIIEQATGILAEHEGITVEAAFVVLREHARSSGVHLSDVARDITNGSGSAAELLHGPCAGDVPSGEVCGRRGRRRAAG